jgi:RNA recognition motif-containing protein
MKLFIGNLPSQGTPEQLSRLLQPYGCRSGIQYNVWRNGEGDLSYFAIVDTESERTAEKLIKNLSDTRFLDSYLVVREYHTRHSFHNERRGPGWRERQWQGEERRIGERRQGSVRLLMGEER